MRFPSRGLAAVLGLTFLLPVAAQLKLPGSGGGPSLSPAPSAPAPQPAPQPVPQPAPQSAPQPAAQPARPSGPAASAPAQPASAPSAQDKEEAGRLAAAGWLILLDRRDWGTAWETSARPFRNSVPLAKWIEGAPKARADFGALVERTPAGVSYKNRLEGLPPGDYVTVIFLSKFADKGEVEEIVTTVREPDGRWRVTGYSTR